MRHLLALSVKSSFLAGHPDLEALLTLTGVFHWLEGAGVETTDVHRQHCSLSPGFLLLKD